MTEGTDAAADGGDSSERMQDMSQVVPGDAFPNGLAALRSLMRGATSISAAVAFVTEPGVMLIEEITREVPAMGIEIVARGADATSPDALLLLRDRYGAEVSVVMGKHAKAFHPKLWLVRSPSRLAVLSGSGNLTRGGLIDNDEQFELIHVAAGSDAADLHEARFERLTANAVSLDVAEHLPIWDEWKDLIRMQRRHRLEIERLGRQLAQREISKGREADKRELLDDLIALYDATVAAKLPRADGKPYVPSRFKQGIDRCRDGADPIVMVARICRRQTEGFDVILRAGRRDLTVEELVLDANKRYHDLFSDQTRRLSADRIEQFAQSLEPDVEVALTTQVVTSADLSSGIIRVPGSSKRLFPEARDRIHVTLLGEDLGDCRWDPQTGPDRDRSGVIGIGRSAAGRLTPGSRMRITRTEIGVRLT